MYLRTLSVLLAASQLAASPTSLNSVNWEAQSQSIPTSLIGGSLSTVQVSGTTGVTTQDNGGSILQENWSAIPFLSGFSLSNTSATVLAVAPNSTATQTLSFSSAVSDVHLIFNYIDSGTSFDFGGYEWMLLSGNLASLNGEPPTVSADLGATHFNHGFIISILGTFGPGDDLVFNYINPTNFTSTIGFTLATPVPEPSTYGLILGGLALAGAAIRRRRNK